VNILKGAVAHNGTAVIDVISPCVTFNNHDGSTKSYTYAKENDELLHQIGFVPEYEQITVDYEPGEVKVVEMHDGSRIILKKLEEDYDPSNAVQAIQRLHRATEDNHMLTGLVYLQPEKKSFIDLLNLTDDSLNTLPLERTRPPREALDKIMHDLM
ncbi:MAG TPA: 2-oxoacid:ferredoxin oxidoreductase subunit beta, partial [Thermoanaerobaculia bacterium]